MIQKSIRATYSFISVDRYLEISTYYLEISTYLKPLQENTKLSFSDTVLEFQALQAKVPERPSVRPTIRLELSLLLILLMHALSFSRFLHTLLKITY